MWCKRQISREAWGYHFILFCCRGDCRVSTYVSYLQHWLFFGACCYYFGSLLLSLIVVKLSWGGTLRAIVSFMCCRCNYCVFFKCTKLGLGAWSYLVLQLVGRGVLFNLCGCTMERGWEIISMCILSVFSLCSDVNVFITSLRFSIVVMDLDGAKFFLWGIVFWLRVGIYENVVV